VTRVAPWLAVAVAAALAAPVARADADSVPVPSDHKLVLHLAAGLAYLHESWSPNDGSPGSAETGWAPALEIAAGRVLSPGLVVGGIWQIASVFSPTESFAGTDYHLEDAIKLTTLIGPFVEDPQLPRIPVRVGIAVGVVASSLRDTSQYQSETTVALALSPYVGYDRRLSRRWSVGALARVTLYRSVLGDTPPSAATTGVLPSMLASFTFR
jgi:hypothetical protein